jgi:hypothetical protein
MVPGAASEPAASIKVPLSPSRALPDDTGEPFEGRQWPAGICPILQLSDPGMVERLAARAASEKRPGDIHHVRRAGALIEKRRAAPPTEAACRSRVLIWVARDLAFAVGDAKTFAPAADVGGIRSAMRDPARVGMIVPSPTSRVVDFEGDGATETLPRDAWIVERFSLHSPGPASDLIPDPALGERRLTPGGSSTCAAAPRSSG